VTITIGKRSGNAIVPLANVTKRTKELDISDYITMQDGRTKNSADVKAVFRADSNDNWEMYIQGNIHTNSASTTAEFTVAGITVRDLNTAGMVFWQCGTARAYAGSGGGIGAYINSYATKPSYLAVSGISSDAEFAFEATVPLASEPTWASLGTTASDALEAVTDASIYIEPASPTQAGIVDANAQSFDGVKTFEAGIKPSSASDTLTHYDEGTWQGYITGSTAGSNGPNTGYYIKIGKLVTATIAFDSFDFTGGTGIISITDLPFSAGSGKYYGSMWSLSLDSDLIPHLVPVIESGNNFIYFYKQGSGSPAEWSSPGAGNYVRMTITYISE
jgi:hypothetical protein